MSVFDYGLPYIDNSDSPNFYLVVNDNRGDLDAYWRNELLAGYPPAYFWLYEGVMRVLDVTADYNVYIDQQYFTANLRLISVFASLITLATLMTLARYLGGKSAGLFAGLVFAVSAEVIELSVLALPDATTTMFMSITALISVISIRKNNVWLALCSTVFALISIAFKYPVAPILLLPASFFLIDLWKRRLKAIPTATLALMMVLATAYYLLYVNGGASFDIAETRNFQGGLDSNLFSVTQWDATLRLFFDALGVGILVLAVLSLAYPFIFKSESRLSKEFWLLLATAIPILALVPLYLVRFSSVRYVYPAMALFTVILAVQQRYLKGVFRWIAIALILGFGLAETGRFIYQQNLPYTASVLQFWAEDNFADDSVIWVENHTMFRTISRFEAGYSGYNDYGLMYAQSDEWRDMGQYVDYVLLADYDIPSWNNDIMRPSLESLLLIKTIDNIGYNGPTITVYDPQPPENLSQIDLHDTVNTLSLRAYETQQDNRSVEVRTYWQAPENAPTLDYSYVLYLTPPDDPSTVIYQQDSGLGLHPTSTWIDSTEMYQGNITPLIIPDDIVSGNYSLRLGIYFWETGERMLTDSDNHIYISEIEIE
ncbi:MAG: hypothetical protein Phog2KO_18030 [Phototrophicaceae bacterium]